jgi:hypothetical protein
LLLKKDESKQFQIILSTKMYNVMILYGKSQMLNIRKFILIRVLIMMKIGLSSFPKYFIFLHIYQSLTPRSWSGKTDCWKTNVINYGKTQTEEEHFITVERHYLKILNTISLLKIYFYMNILGTSYQPNSYCHGK